ncbi:DNA polymerase III subunit delta [Streptococcus pacificus]|uniref:DNA polymerase III subunit delta n=1 Tax=Streptococcus pacificus TaxID=2740577 RepID=A0ABS0ZI11_9STRE|nr:DNA polymerase III subunit delta [Streptococcus pacificus]MBJ8325646.1 DNA polymerase III subunit delta [Streptococcus pacificus]
MIAIEKIAQLTKTNLAQITVLTGEDQGQYAQMKNLLFEQLDYHANDLGISYFDMSTVVYQDAQMELESLPFFSEDKIVIFDYFVDITTTKKTYLDSKEIKQFENYLEHPIEATKLIILAPGKLDSKKRVVKLLKRDAVIFEANPLKEREFKTYFQKYAHQLGLVFDSGVFEELVIRSNVQFDDMMKNLLFLESYQTNGRISHQDIVDALPKTLKDNIFDLTQFIMRKQIDEARLLVHDLILQGEDEVKLLAIMISQLRTMLQVKLLSLEGYDEKQIIDELSHYLGRRVNPYQVKYALRDTRTLSVTFLKQSLYYLIDTDYQIKSGQYEKDYLFDLALLKLTTLDKQIS